VSDADFRVALQAVTQAQVGGLAPALAPADTESVVRIVLQALSGSRPVPVRETDDVLAQEIHRVAGCQVGSERTRRIIAWYRMKSESASG
jgi:hypothetical protein